MTAATYGLTACCTKILGSDDSFVSISTVRGDGIITDDFYIRPNLCCSLRYVSSKVKGGLAFVRFKRKSVELDRLLSP
jgi:hypothetical protein